MAVRNDCSLQWWYSLHKIPNFTDAGSELVRKENGVWCILPYHWQEGLLQRVDLPEGGARIEEKTEPDDTDKRRYIEECYLEETGHLCCLRPGV